MYFVRTPGIVRALFKGPVWTGPSEGKALYLTFDDGPEPTVTPWVLDQLSGYDARATFFCIGRNCDAHPALMERIRATGHSIGNHTQDHVRGGPSSQRAYLRSVLQCQQRTGTRLFRPPYMDMTWAQYRAVRKRFDVVLCDVLSGDFDTRIDGATCLQNVTAHAKSGSIIVFHDSLKADERLRYALPRVLQHYAERGFSFRALAT